MAAPHRVSFAAAHQPSKSAGRPGGIRTPSIRFWRPALYQLELLACIPLKDHLMIVTDLELFRLLVHSVVPAPGTKLLHLQTFRRLLFVLVCGVISLFA